MNKIEMLERMDPELRSMYEMLPPNTLTPADQLPLLRRGSLDYYRTMTSAFERYPDIQFQCLIIPGGPDNDSLTLRIYSPREYCGSLPVILNFHGGGCVLNSAEEDDPYCLEMTSIHQCVVVNVDYRLAPEHPWPAGQLDGCAAWRWICTKGVHMLNLDLKRSVFFGVSGGGNIVLGTAMRLLDENERLPALLMPLYPMVDDRGITLSSMQITDTSVWGRSQNIAAWDYYLQRTGKEKKEEVSEYAAPARRKDFSGLPPVFTMVGGLELFRDEVLELVGRLARSGVPVEFKLYPGCFHAFDRYCPEADVSKRAHREIHDCLQRTFNK